MTARFLLFLSIALIPKLNSKANYEEWHNNVQDFCKMNELWWYMLGQISKPKLPSSLVGKKGNKRKKVDKKAQEAYKAKLFPWLTVIDFFQEVMKLTCTLDPISHNSNL